MSERASGYGSCEVMRLRSSGGRESKGDVIVVVDTTRNGGVVFGFAGGSARRLGGWKAK